MDKIEQAREMFMALEGRRENVADIARRTFCIQDRLAGLD